MTSGKNGSLRYAMFALALLAVITLGFTAFASEDSYAATSGAVEDSLGNEIGTYNLDAYTLTVNASKISNVTEVTLVDFTEKGAVTHLVIKGFTKDILGSFSEYTLTSIIYTGNVTDSATGTWKYDYKTKVLTLSSTATTSGITSATLIGFGDDFKDDVSELIIKGFTQDLYLDGTATSPIATSFPSTSYTSLTSDSVSYQGDIMNGATDIGDWKYTYHDKHLSLIKAGTSTALPTNWNATGGPCNAYYFKNQALSATIEGFLTGGDNVLNGFSKLETFTTLHYTDTTRPNLLAGLSNLKVLEHKVVASVNSNTASAVKLTLEELKAPAATTVGDNAFKEFLKLTTIELGKVTTIGSSSFYGCTLLRNLTLTEIVTIGNYAFYNCGSIASLKFDNLTTVGVEAFKTCSSLKNIDCKNLVTVNGSAFYECKMLTTVNTPALVTVGGSAFYNCTSLNSINFGSSTTIGANAFQLCESLEVIDAEAITYINYYAFRGCVALKGENNILNFSSLQKIESNSSDSTPFGGSGIVNVKMPLVQEMGSHLFYGCSTLKSVSIGTLNNIPTNTFYGCTALASVTLTGTQGIGTNAFYGCTALQEITLPDSLTSIGSTAFSTSGLTEFDTNMVQTIGGSAFVGCSFLKSLTIGAGLVSIGSQAFDGVPIAGTVDFSAAINLTTIGTYSMRQTGIETLVFSEQAVKNASILGYAFYNCDQLTSVSFGNRIVSIGDRSFYDCNQLKNIYFNTDSFKGSSIVTIETHAFYNTNNASCDLKFPASLAAIGANAFQASAITSVSFEEGADITTFTTSVFYGCKSLTSINIPKDVTEIASSAFNGCTSLRIVSLDQYSALKYVRSSAFSGCTALTSKINFPASLQILEASAFYNCNRLSGVSFDTSANSKLESIGNNCFFECRALDGSITFPKSLTLLSYRSFYNCVELDGVSFDQPSVSSLESIEYQSFHGCAQISNDIIFPDFLKEIEYSAFEGCSMLGGITFSVNSKLTTLGNSAFLNCTSMDGTVRLPSTLGGELGLLGEAGEKGVLGTSAFHNCTSLEGISFAENIQITVIPASCFRATTSLTGTVTIPASIVSIDTLAFYQSGLTGLEFAGNNLQYIRDSAFESCPSLTDSISFPLSLKVLEQDAFYDCNSLTGIEFAPTDNQLSESQLTSIGTMVFFSCGALTGTIKFPDNLEIIDYRAFESCTNLTGIWFNKTNSKLETIGHRTFYNCQMTGDLVLPNSLVTIGTVGSTDEAGTFRLNNFESIEFGTGLKYIGYQAFRDCDRLLGTRTPEGIGPLMMPASLLTIDTLAFYSCNKLAGIKFVGESNLETLGSRAFEASVSLASVECLSVVDHNLTIYADAFKGCTALTYFVMNNAKTLGNNVLDGCKGLLTLGLASATTVPKAAYDECTVLSVVDFGGIATIDANMFKNFTTLTSINVKSATSIGDNAFYGCINLVTADVTNATNIGVSAFEGCTALTTVTATSAKTIGNKAFNGCMLFTGIQSYEKLITIGDYAFNECTSLDVDDGNMELPLVESIGTAAFYNCPITSFVLGPEVIAIGDRALHNSNLTSISVDGDNESFIVMDGVLYDYAKRTLLYSPVNNAATSITIPDSVLLIKPYAFQGATNLKSVVFPTSSLSIGEYAFYASGISGKLTITEYVSSIGAYAFADCTALTELAIETINADVLGAYAFKGCSSLEILTIPIKVQMVTDGKDPVFDAESNITKYNFFGFGKSDLVANYYSTYASKMPWYYTTPGTANISVSFADGVTDIDAYMFKATAGNSRILSITMPDTVTTIGSEAFMNCSKIKEIAFSKNVTTLNKCLTGCTSIQTLTLPIHADATTFGVQINTIKTLNFINGGKASANYTSSTYKNQIWYGSSNYVVSFEDGISSIGDYMQLSASGSVSIPSSVTSVGKMAFYMSTMTSLTIVDGLTKIGDNAFEKCTGLQSLTLPNTLVTIGTTPFKDCTNLRTVNLPITVDYSSNMFDGCRSLSTFIFKAGTDGIGHNYTSATAQKTPWFGICGMYDFTVSFEPGVKSIGNYMFQGCVQYGAGGYRGITGTITFLDSVTSIGNNAFDGCYNVTSFTFGTGLTTIGAEAFKGCTKITSVTIEDRITSIGAGAFSGCV
ncbi:MAG: leucine-rich repeat domain-containing protein [Candidatus Methanomethylophilaceae archaeon]|nr:leucine-rich repeat domain-containing protein [Candidatus Methanomethylophilaceae archaeon]